MEYELKLQSGKVAVWTGKTPEDAARRYVDAMRPQKETVVAWRNYPRFGVFALGRGSRIIEPGEPGW